MPTHVREPTRSPPAPILLFYRDIVRFTGGHLKVFHYFEHVRSSGLAQPRIVFSSASIWGDDNPWSKTAKCYFRSHWCPSAADALFLGGRDWEQLPLPERLAPRRPVINLIQHVRHADPGHPLFEYLEYPAVRICVSDTVKTALERTGRVNGPLISIPNGLDAHDFPAPRPDSQRDLELLVVATKRPVLAQRLSRELHKHGIDHRIIMEQLPRSAFLDRIGHARVALFLPDLREGFYLPAAEAFMLRTLVICPDVLGNRGFCRPDETCVAPAAYGFDEIMDAVLRALTLSEHQRAFIVDNALAIGSTMTLARERLAFLSVLQRLPELWQHCRHRQ